MNETSYGGESSVERADPSSDSRYRRLIERLPAIVWEGEPNSWRFTLVSPYAESLLGYPLERWYEADFWVEQLHEDDRERVLTCCCEVIAEGLERELEYRMVAADGRVVWLRAVMRVEFCDGQPARLSGTMVDITECKRVEEELMRRRADAEESSRLKTEFLANMSHEIGTPMNGVIGFAELLAMEDLTDQQSEWVSIIRNCGQELLVLIDDILDISKIEANQLRVESCPFAIADVLSDVRQTNSPTIEGRGLSFSIDCADDTPQTMHSDPQRLRQILGNLLTNALKFTDSGGISVRVRGGWLEDKPAVRFEVADTGVGIAPESQDVIFEVFKQVDSSASRKYEGSGLGLAICKRLTKLLGGRIWVESCLGKGATFIFVLPVEASLPGSTNLTGGNAMEQIEHDELDSAEPTGESSGEPAGILRLEGRVLLVEDSQINRSLFKIILERVGLQVDLAVDGQQGVEMACGQEYDLILMDLQMGVLDGLEATRLLRDKGLSTPIIALTAHSSNEDRKRCLEAGCDGFLAKPLNQGTLLATVQDYIGQKKDLQLKTPQ